MARWRTFGWNQKPSKTDYKRQDHGEQDTSVEGLDEQSSSDDYHLKEEDRRTTPQHSLFQQDPPGGALNQPLSYLEKVLGKEDFSSGWNQETDYKRQDHGDQDTSVQDLDKQSSSANDHLKEEDRRKTRQHSLFQQDPSGGALNQPLSYLEKLMGKEDFSSGSELTQAKKTPEESEKLQIQGVTEKLIRQSSDKHLNEWEEESQNKSQNEYLEDKDKSDFQIQAVQEEVKELQREEKQLNMKKEQLERREKQLNRQDTQRKENEIKIQEEKISQKNTNLNSREEQLERKENEIKIHEEKIRQKNTNLNSREEELERKEKEIKIQEEKIRQKNKTLNTKEEQLKDQNDDLCSKSKDIEIRQHDLTNKRREFQLEQLQKQENEIHMEIEMIKKLTKMKQETEEEKNKNEKIVKAQYLQIERNFDELQKQKEQKYMLENEISHIKKENQSEKHQIIRENQQIEEMKEVLKRQWTEMETEKEKIQGQKVANKEVIDRQDLAKLKNEEEIKSQEALLHKLKEKMNECEETLRTQENLKQTNGTEIQQQINQLQEQTRNIDAQSREIDEQKRDILKHRGIIKQTRRKIQTLKTVLHNEEKEREMKNDSVQKQQRELERQKEMHEQTMNLIQIETELQKHKDLRRREEDLQILQNIHDQLENRKCSSNYTQEGERDIKYDLEKIIETMKIEIQRSLEDLTEEPKLRQMEQERGKKDELGDAKQDSTDTTGGTLQTPKGSEENETPKSFTSHSDSQSKKSHLKSLMELLQSLSLDNVYPHKLSSESFLSIDGSKKKQSDCSVAFIYLQKLLKLNYRARFITEENRNQEPTLSSRRGGKCAEKDITDVDFMPDAMEDNGDASAKCEPVAEDMSQVAKEMQEIPHTHDLLDELLSESNETDSGEVKENIHPMDVQMAVFHCADNFLRQHIVNKLSSCQYALPLLVPNPLSSDIELPLWTFRQVNKTWSSADGSSRSTSVIHMKTPMVFFCRLGSVSTSKSQLLNSLINPKHDAFFHRDSPGSSKSSLFKDGLVEIAWYCPAGNSDDLFSECIAFCNLHGDASEYREQTDFLAEIAAVNVVLMENMKPNDKGRELLEMIHKSPKPLICLVNEQQKGPLKITKGLNMKLGLKDRNKDELENELKLAVQNCLQKCSFSPAFSLEESSSLAKRHGFSVDEDCKDCQEGKTRAVEVMTLLGQMEGEDISKIKEMFLPCHGKLWHEWAQKNKVIHRLHEKREHTSQDKIRAKQQGKSLTFMKNIAKHFLSANKTQTQYLVQWIRMFIDDKFSNAFTQLHRQYSGKWFEVQKLRNEQAKSEELNTIQKELHNISKELDSLTIGLEHFFREMGQIYEAWARVPDETGSDVSAFPAVAADFLISGHPLELMDGDAAHVPLTWIESVLDKVIERLGDQKVFVLSVLGLQSSGKSTMLNTMFGLQFAVRAGRCTRGAFMQLVRVKEEAKEELKFDYLLVVDTEGLQALELAGKSTFSHDNELATFVICFANMTLINVFGENPAEIQEILQIVVQAILRMKTVHFQPNCMFVHQNITDLTSAQRNMEGRRRLQQQLDKITIAVAKEEGCQVKYFTDVIKCNFNTDVHYFAQLWKGNPPMAPPNPLYSVNAERLKQSVLKVAAQEKTLRLSELKIHLKEVWDAVLNEDFVFSFKNSLELAKHRKKCTQTLKMESSHLQDKMNKTQDPIP